MFCKQTQNTIDTLLRLGLYESSNDNKNKIASLMSKPNRNRKDNETLCVSLINELMDAHQNQNKIAVVESKNRMGEVAEFQSLLQAHLQLFSPQELQ